MQESIAQEVQDALTQRPEEIVFEQLQSENSSPLNQPVIEKDIGGERPVETEEEKQKSWNVWKPEKEVKSIDELEPGKSDNTQPDFRSSVEANVQQEKAQEPLDAPEQEINGEPQQFETKDSVSDQDFQMPLAQANQAADALLGMTNNVMVVGGGYFVKVRKHKEFYEFEEIVQVIDSQNEKNVERVKLDAEDQALLRPLLAQVLRKKAKQLTPEQQLMGAVVSILMKKAQVVMEVRAENSLLEERILDIIREEKGQSEFINENEVEEEIEEDLKDTAFAKAEQKNIKEPPEKPVKTKASESTIQDIKVEEVDDDISILEVADETENVE